MCSQTKYLFNVSVCCLVRLRLFYPSRLLSSHVLASTLSILCFMLVCSALEVTSFPFLVRSKGIFLFKAFNPSYVRSRYRDCTLQVLLSKLCWALIFYSLLCSWLLLWEVDRSSGTDAHDSRLLVSVVHKCQTLIDLASWPWIDSWMTNRCGLSCCSSMVLSRVLARDINRSPSSHE